MNRPVCQREADYNFLQREFKTPYRQSVRVARWAKREANRARRRFLRAQLRTLD